MSAERGLWAAVVLQAFSDAFTPTFGTTEADRRLALRFLLAADGIWVARRDEVASYIGTEGEIVRKHAKAILDGKVTFGVKDRRVPHDLEQARRLFEDVRQRPQPTKKEQPMTSAQIYPVTHDTWLCFQVREDGTLFLPKGKPLIGLHDGLPLPNGSSFQARVMRELTKPFGASLQTLRAASKYWLRDTKAICELYDLEVILKAGPHGIPGGIDAMDGSTKAYIRRRPRRAA